MDFRYSTFVLPCFFVFSEHKVLWLLLLFYELGMPLFFLHLCKNFGSYSLVISVFILFGLKLEINQPLSTCKFDNFIDKVFRDNIYLNFWIVVSLSRQLSFWSQSVLVGTYYLPSHRLSPLSFLHLCGYHFPQSWKVFGCFHLQICSML